MAVNPKFVKFLSAIEKATAQGRLEWKNTASDDAFSAELSQGVVRISRCYDEETNSLDTVASLVDYDGNTLDVLSSADVNDAATVELLRSVHQSARRQARQVDKLLDVLITELESPRT